MGNAYSAGTYIKFVEATATESFRPVSIFAQDLIPSLPPKFDLVYAEALAAGITQRDEARCDCRRPNFILFSIS